jgi:cation transport protein ChaC
MKQFWIFGYGSLMWRPGFRYIRQEAAIIQGYHRSLCVYSFVHRGTRERPGLVLGLDEGGACQGIAYEIRPEDWIETIAYLRTREQVTSVYVEKEESIRLLASGLNVNAVTYAVDRNHVQYAGVLPEDALLHHVRKGRGISGQCIAYVLNTVAHLRSMNIHDEILESLAFRLKDQAAISSADTESEQP